MFYNTLSHIYKKEKIWNYKNKSALLSLPNSITIYALCLKTSVQEFAEVAEGSQESKS